jgi:hypothetical protein
MTPAMLLLCSILFMYDAVSSQLYNFLASRKSIHHLLGIFDQSSPNPSRRFVAQYLRIVRVILGRQITLHQLPLCLI